jgi:hypothetical protein
MIKFYPEIEKIISEAGFNNSSELFVYLKKSHFTFTYERMAIYIKSNLDSMIENFQILNDGFLFTCNSYYKGFSEPQFELIYFALITKEDLLKAIKLKAFS